MITFDYTLTDPMGLHARPAGQLVKEAKAFASKITVTCKGQSAEAVRMMAIMRLGTKAGDTVTVCVEGADEEAAASAIKTFFEENT